MRMEDSVITLSANFTLDELTYTSTGLPNAPTMEQAINLKSLAQTILQPIRDKFGPVHVNSGYRTQAVQDALTASGHPTSKKSSQHLDGAAADIVVPGHDLKEVFEWIRKNLDFGQVILEEHNRSTWIHVSLPRTGKPNWQALYYRDGRYENA